MTNIIVAYDQNRAIGSNGDMPWGRKLRGDLDRFKRLTYGHSVIMGRRTFESIGRPLPGRENIILTRSPLVIRDAICVDGLARALSIASDEAFIIGGGEIYREALPVADTVLATEIHASFDDVDTFFPALDSNWREVERSHQSHAETGDPYDYDFVRYVRTH